TASSSDTGWTPRSSFTRCSPLPTTRGARWSASRRPCGDDGAARNGRAPGGDQVGFRTGSRRSARRGNAPQPGKGAQVANYVGRDNMGSTRSRSRLISGLILAIGLTGAGLAGAGAYRLLTRITIPGEPLASFDISWVDPTTQTYYLADR